MMLSVLIVLGTDRRCDFEASHRLVATDRLSAPTAAERVVLCGAWPTTNPGTKS
jgi:hypothetical protein